MSLNMLVIQEAAVVYAPKPQMKKSSQQVSFYDKKPLSADIFGIDKSVNSVF